VTSRLPWLDAWREAYPQWGPWVLGLRDGGGRLQAVAALARRRRAQVVQIRCLAHTGLDHAPIASRTAAHARALAAALASDLHGLHRPWVMHLRQLPVDDAFAHELAHRLPAAEIQRGLERPLVRLAGTPSPSGLLSRNLRQAEARARNRIARAGVTLELRWITEPQATARRVPEIRSVHRARDLQLRGASQLDHPAESAFYDALPRRHLDALQMLDLRLDGEVAAYVLWVRDGATRLVLDNRVAPRGTDYSAGLIANNAALRTAAADPRVAVLDWGAGVQRYKLQSANVVVADRDLVAWSSRRLRYALGARRVAAVGGG
jgi:hypothetical protein